MYIKYFYLCQTGQIHQRQAENVGRVDLQVDWLSVDALIVSSYPRGFILNLPLHLLKVSVLLAGSMMEFGPFRLLSYRGSSMWNMDLVSLWRILLARDVDELQDKWSPRNNAASSRQKVSADDVLEDG